MALCIWVQIMATHTHTTVLITCINHVYVSFEWVFVRVVGVVVGIIHFLVTVLRGKTAYSKLGYYGSRRPPAVDCHCRLRLNGASCIMIIARCTWGQSKIN
ncbi:hypothetical protein F5888DRAFT_1669335, partial [Russula emetica]